MFELPIATPMSECLNRKLKGLTNFRSPDAMSEFKPRYHAGVESRKHMDLEKRRLV